MTTVCRTCVSATDNFYLLILLLMNTHTTSTGDTIFISQMEDSHLINTINVIAKKVQKAREVIEGGVKNTVDMIVSWYDSERVVEYSKNVIRNWYENIQSYVFEASLRWISVTSLLQLTFGRWEKTAALNVIQEERYCGNDSDSPQDASWSEDQLR